MKQTAEYKSLSKRSGVRRYVGHMLIRFDAIDGSGMFPGCKRLERELKAKERSIKRWRREARAAGVFVVGEARYKESGRETTKVYFVNPALNIEPGYVTAGMDSDTPYRDAEKRHPLLTPPDDTPGSTYVQSEAPLRAHIEAAMSRSDYVADELAAAGGAVAPSSEVYLAGETSGQNTIEIPLPRNDFSAFYAAQAEFVEAFRAMHGREPHEHEHIEPRKYGYAKEAARLRWAATVPW